VTAVGSFADTARRFCAWVDRADHDLTVARALLLDLLRQVVELPDAPAPGDAPDAPDRTHDDYRATVARLGDLPFQYYWTFSSPTDLDDEAPVTGDVLDDLADIHGDLRGGLALLHAGHHDAATAHWRWSYIHHWGQHATGALWAIDSFLRESPDHPATQA
jgi:hypothetical protein